MPSQPSTCADTTKPNPAHYDIVIVGAGVAGASAAYHLQKAVDEGTIGKILIAEATADVKVNTPIAVLLEEGESAADITTGSAPTNCSCCRSCPWLPALLREAKAIKPFIE